MIADNIRHVKKVQHEFFHHCFDRVIYLIIKFIVEIQSHIKINAKKFVKYFSNIDYDVHYHLAKSQI
jgi:hypothetical protein